MKNGSSRTFILSTLEHFYGKPNLLLDDKTEDILSDFISNSQSLLLQSSIDGDALSLQTQIQNIKDKSVIFCKTPSQHLGNGDDISGSNLNVITLSSNPAESLYHALRQVYSPLLTAENDVYSIKLQKNLADLEAILRTLTYGKNETNTNIILSVEDELEYWKSVVQNKDVNKKEKEAAAAFCDLFQDICEEIKVLQSSNTSEMREAAENIGGLLDDVWRFTSVPYSQARMTHVFDIIGRLICCTAQKTVSSVDLWKVDDERMEYETLTLLSECLKVVQTWTSACKTLTETYWPNYALHAWNGKAYVPLFCQKFESRLKEIHDIRSTHSQLNKLLSKNEKSELQTEKLFAPFQNINVWMCYGVNTSWDTAVSKFAASLRPAEAKIAEKLKPRLHNTSTKQMLYEFMRYRALIERPLVKHALNNELEIFVSSLLSMLNNIQNQLDSDEMDVKMYRPPEMSPVVHQIQWAKQTESKVKEIQTCAELYLKEFEGSSELLRVATQLLKDLKAMYMQWHEEWSRDLQAQAKNGLLQLSTKKPVVEFSGESKMMEVMFNPRLVWAELEARSLAALGLPSPPAAAALDCIASALTHARALQQVASFHNTLGERMIPSTRPMMLQAALDLSSLVQNQKAVYWDDMEQLANYTDKLKKAVLKLETQNTYLTSQHVAIRSIVEKLMDTELLAKQSEWKKGVKDIRDIIERVEANGYKNTELWRTHWDWQLYKALECQYIKTLLSLHKHFPLVRVDLVLRGHSVRPQPCMEDLRVQHYHQLRRLVSLPAQFVGLSLDVAAQSKQNIFSAIVDKHGWLGNKAVKQLEAALSSLERTCKQWTRRAALACVPDLEALCTEHLKEPSDWETNFKACKAYGQAVAKMTFEDEKIEWLVVGTASLRREFEAQARSLWACLMSSLQSSCRAAAATLDAFVATAHATLQERPMPKNAKQLAEISAKQQALQEKMPEMESTMEALKKKGHMLRTWGGDASVDGTIKEWQKVRELIHSQQQMFEHQAEIVKSSLRGEWENLNTGVEAWVSRWSQARARMEETRDVAYCVMVERCLSVLQASEQWNNFQQDRDDLIKECQKFNMQIEISEIWNQAETMMAEYLCLWTVFNRYKEEFESIAEQDWIVFQKKLHMLDEFITKWKGNLEPYTAVTLFLQQELDKYSDLTPILKYLRGTDFTERHWREVFGLLEMECKKPDTLQVKDLLAVASNIKKHIKSLQKICASASSESAIRSALNELELWYAGARFTIIYYDDKSKRQTPIVKDFKEISAKIEEQQWVVSSLGGGGSAGGAGADACAAWDLRLRAARRLARTAHHAQRRWLYLEPILCNEEGELATKFRKVDQGFRQVARLVEADPRLSALLHSTRLQPMLDSISEQLLACQTALNQYIDEKRSTFPRLYFLSDDDLLELLGQARAGAEGRAAVMQTHLKKLFPGATGVCLGPGDMSITALASHHGETLQLEHPVDIDCPVEVWLKNLEAEMRSSLKNITLKCVLTNSLQNQDPFSLPTQILCLAQNIRFTEQAERAITSRELHKLKGNVEKENSHYASADLEDESERNKRQALILQCAHYMSVIRSLIDSNVTSTNDWLWQKQLRFYLMGSKDVVAKMGLAQISYSYEYLGVNTGQFVRTELADDCFLILTQSLHLGMVGNPFGPAGTGKTESVKALGGLVGRLVLIFNCDEAMDSECFGRLLTGLALCGAWGCFDEFNRMSGDTLAAAAVQLHSLLAAASAPAPTATALLNGKQVRVSAWCGVAATMNPAGRGYGGRRELPASLGRVLRPVAMVAPRADSLARHLLAASGVPHDDHLAADLYNVFTMAGALITDERHYDWGLRALKASVCSAAAALVAPSGTDRPLATQRAALRRLLARDNMSKLTRDSALRFENILSLVFVDVPLEEPVSDPVKKAIEASVDNLKLAHNKHQVQKCAEFYEQLQQRMGVVIVGPPGSGKTTIRRMLKNALINQGKNIVEYTICPKAMSRDWLLGNIDHDTRQWTDGVISATALEVSNQPADVWSWVVCDGDIDPEWVEALNSVLDDNRLLTLPSGWRIQFGANVNFVFETHGLEHASPATVSRMGVILLSDDASCGLDLLSNWVQRADIDQEIGRSALPLLQQATERCMHWLLAHKSDLVLKLHDIALVKQILVQIEYLIQNLSGNTDRTTAEELVYLAIEKSVMDVLKDSAVDALHQELSPILGVPPPQPARLHEWVTESLLMSARLAATEPVLRACLASDTGHLLLVGPDASAKNILAEYLIKESNSTLIVIDCTPVLEPSDIIAELRRNNVVRSGSQSGAGGGNNSRVTVLVRSLHRAHIDVWGTSAVHSFLLQLIEYKGFWSRGGDTEGGATAAWSSVSRVRLIATAHSAALTPRLAARLAVSVIPEADEDELLELVKYWLQQNVDKNMQAKDILVLAGTILTMFKEVTETFHSRPQYNWNASHLKRWCENVKWFSPANIEQLDMAITAEANAIFKDRLVTEEEKSRFANITRKYFKTTNDLYFACNLRGEGVFMEPVDYGLWHHSTEKLINQCLSEYDYNTFGDSGAEICSELVVLCDAMTRACNGGLSVCVGSSGVGRRAAALVTAAAVSASTLFVHHPSQFYNTFKNAVSSAASGSRVLVVVCECAARKEELAQLEALRRAEHAHALPAPLRANQLSHEDLDNIKTNLGIVICLDERQSNLPELLDKFPMLYNEAHLLWLSKWSHDTLRDMPALVIQRMAKENLSDLTKDQLDAIPTDGFVKIHTSLESESLKAPNKYVHFIKSYHNIVVKKKSALLQRQAVLSAGVEALRRARSEVASLQAEAGEQEALLSEKQAKANSALDQISATVRATTDKKEEMHALKTNIELENEKLQVQKKEIEAELASVEPVIAAARAAVGDIRPESLSEVRSLRAPPDVVRDVLEGVLRLMGIADTSWHSMKNFLSKRGVKEDIRCLDARQISPAALASVQRLVASRNTSFTAAAARRASAACAPLAAWVRANIDYAQALQRVQPLKDHQAQLHRNLVDAEAQLAALSSGLATVDERVLALKEQLGQHTRDAAALELRLATAAGTIRAATALLDHLLHEYSAWQQDLENIHREISDLNQRSLLAAAYLVYLSEATEPESREYVKKWSALIGFEDETFSVINFLSSTEKQLNWEAAGLSTDLSAVKNAVLIDQVLESPQCGVTPVMLDPDGEGLAWLRTSLADTPSDFVSQHSEKLLTTVQYAVRLGRILVITDVDEVHPCWVTLVRALPPARLVLVSRHEALPARLPPHVARRVAPLHFTARLHPLTDQLINYALHQQNPEISEKAKEIKSQKAKLQKEQYELQENLLRELSRNADILHDAGLLASLESTRAAADTVRAALAQAREVEAAAEAARARLHASACRGAALALAVKRLHVRWPLVSLPIDAALQAYVDAVKKVDQANSEEVVKYLTRRIIERVLLALHKKDKYIVVLHLLKQVYDDLMPDKLWQIFIGNDDVNDDALDTKEIKKMHPWVPDERLKGIAKLKAADENLYNRLSLTNNEEWKQFICSGDVNILHKYKLSPFERVVSVAALRPDTLYRVIVALVDSMLGPGAVFGGSAIDIAARGRRPVLLLGTHAHDALAATAPPHALTTIDASAGVSEWRSALVAARASGSWLALSAAGAPLTADLQAFVADAAKDEGEKCNEEFRLWILSEYREVPPLIANTCINVILEAPEGVKNNVLSTMSAWGGERAETAVAARLLACLALFHALVQERRNYIPQGWSQWYAWEWGEVRACGRAARGAEGGAAALCLALYGARVQSAADARALAALHARALPPHHAPPAWQPPAFPNLPAATNDLQTYASAFASLPDMDSPQLLGLPANCRAAWERAAAIHIRTTLKELNCTVVASAHVDGATSTKNLASLWKKSMSGSPLLKEGWNGGSGAGGWWDGAARGEAAHAARAARRLHAALRAAARHHHVLHETPESWQVWWAGPRAPDVYLREFCHRARAAVARLEQHAADDYMPAEVDLRGFLHGSRALWALRARTAQRRRLAPAALALLARTGGEDSACEDEMVVRGLRLSGAECAAAGLEPARAHAPPHAPAPPLHAKYIALETSGEEAAEGWLDVPVYSSEAREELLFNVRVQLARSFPRETAHLNAVALFVAPLD